LTERFFVPCPRGLEAVLADELRHLGAGDVSPADGGAGCAGDFGLALSVNLESRIASRVLWEVGAGAYRDEKDLYELVASLPWPARFAARKTIRVNVAATLSPLTSLEFATLRIKDAVCDRFRRDTGERPSVDKQRPDVRIHAYLTRDACTLYLDTSGEPLFKRGYRRPGAEAPIRENLAAGLLALAGWRGDAPLLDPMCGSGTIAIEAALLAADAAPGAWRDFGFRHLAWFDGPRWQRLRDRARQRRRESIPVPVVGRDRDARAIAAARAHAEAAGVAGIVSFEVADVLRADAPRPPGVIVSNPPYGVRLEAADAMAAFYPKLGDALKQRFAGWTAWLLSGDPRLPSLIGLRPSRRTPLFNGALECRFYRFEIVTGALRRKSAGAGAPPAPPPGAV
jgi:putative N6-adenine-specific DNA methylase